MRRQEPCSRHYEESSKTLVCTTIVLSIIENKHTQTHPRTDTHTHTHTLFVRGHDRNDFETISRENDDGYRDGGRANFPGVFSYGANTTRIPHTKVVRRHADLWGGEKRVKLNLAHKNTIVPHGSYRDQNYLNTRMVRTTQDLIENPMRSSGEITTTWK